MFYVSVFVSACLSVCLFLSHTHTHTNSLSLSLTLFPNNLEYFVPNVGAEYVDHAPAVSWEVLVRPLVERDHLQQHHGIIAVLIDR